MDTTGKELVCDAPYCATRKQCLHYAETAVKWEQDFWFQCEWVELNTAKAAETVETE